MWKSRFSKALGAGGMEALAAEPRRSKSDAPQGAPLAELVHAS